MPRGGATNTFFEYRGWDVAVGRVGVRGEYDAIATNGGSCIRTRRFSGVGAKQRATDEIKALIDRQS